MKMKKRVGAAAVAAVILAGAVTCFANFSDVSELFEMRTETSEEREAAADEPISDVSAQSDSGTEGQSFNSAVETVYKEKHYRTNMTKAYESKNAAEESVDPQSGDLTICQTDYSVPLTNGSFDIKRIFHSNLACADYSASRHFAGVEELESYYSSVYHMGDGWRLSFPILEIIPIDKNRSNWDGTKTARILYHSESGAVYSITPLIEDAGNRQEAPKVKFSIQNHGSKDIEVKYNYGDYSSYYEEYELIGIDITHKKEGVTYKFGKYGYISEIIYNNSQNENADTVSFVYIDLYSPDSGTLSADGLNFDPKYAVDHIDVKTRGMTQTISFQYQEGDLKLLAGMTLPGKKTTTLPGQKTTIEYAYTESYTEGKRYKNAVLKAVYDTDKRIKYLFNTGKVSVQRIYDAEGSTLTSNVGMNTIESIVYARENRASVYSYKVTEDAATKWQYASVTKHCDYEITGDGISTNQVGPETTYEYPSGQEVLETSGLYTETFEQPIGSEESFWEQNTYAGNNTNGTFDLWDGYVQSWRRMHSELLSKGEYGNFVINTTIRFVEGSISRHNSAGVVFGVSEFNSGNNNFDGYYARISPENYVEGDENKNTIALFKMHSNSQNPNADTKEELLAMKSFSEAGLGESCRDDVSYPMKIVKDGALVEIYVIDMTTPALKYEDESLVNVGGKVGLRTFQRRAAYTSFRIALEYYGKFVNVSETDGTKTVKTMYCYDNDSNMTEKRVDYGDYAVTEQYAYDKRRLPTEIRTSEYSIEPSRELLWEKCERYTYDDYGNVIEYKNPFADMSGEDGAQPETVKYKYDARWCLPTEKLEVMNETTAVKTTYTLSGDGTRITGETVTEISGGAEKAVRNTKYTYDEYGRITSETITGGNTEGVSQKNYDYNYSDGQFTTQITTGNITRTVTTDAYSGNVVYESDGTHPVTYKYDALDRLIKITFGKQLSEEEKKRGMKNTVEYTYGHTMVYWYAETQEVKFDDAPVSITRTDENDCTTKTIYDSCGRPIEEIRGKEGQTVTSSNTYDIWGRLLSSTDEDGNVTSYTYDNMNRLVNKATGDYAEEYTYSYNLDGATTGRSEKTVTKTYLKAGKSAGSDRVTYDVLGRTIMRTDGEGNKTETRYDGMGNTISVTDGNGNKTVFEYDALGRLISSVKDDGSFTRYSYNAFDKVKRKENGLTENNYEYDGAGNVTEEKQNIIGENKGFYKKYYYTYCGKVTCIETGTYIGEEEFLSEKEDINYGDRDWVTQSFKYINDENGQSVYYLYDNRGSVISEKEYLDGSIYYDTLREYDFDGRVTKETVQKATGQKDESGETIFEVITETCYEYDKRGNLTKKTSTGISESCVYDAAGRIVSKTAPNGLVTSYEYDGRGNTVKESYMRGEEEIVKSYEYDLAGRLTTETDPEGNKTRYFYDGAGNIVKTIGPRYQGGNSALIYEYDAKNRLVKTTAMDNGAETVIEELTYDEADRVITQKSGDITVTYQYDAMGNATAVTVGEDNTTYNEYDGSGRVTKNTDANKNTTCYEYYFNGLPKSVTYADGVKVSYDWNEFDETGKYMQTAKDRAGNKTVTDYNIFGKPTKVTYPDDNTEEFTYDALGRMLTSKDRCGTVTSYTYDNNGNITEKSLMNNGNEIKETYNYSLDNLLLSYTDPCGKTTSYSYDKAGNLTVKNNPNGTVETYVYDGDAVASQNVNGITTDFTYDVRGNVIAQTTAERTTAYQYDPAGNVTIKINPDGGRTEYAYDKAGRLTSQTFGESVTQYVYDRNGNVKTKIMNTSPVSQTAYEYDDMNNLVKMNDNGIETAYEYDNLGRCVKVTIDGAVSETYYDLMGNVYASKNAKDQITLYTYDRLGRLLSTADSVSDNAIADIKNVEQYKNGNDFTKAMQYTYDEMGNKLTETNARDKANRYIYDNCGRVLSVNYPDGNSVSYTYDGCGNMLTMTDAKENTTNYEYENNRLVKTYDSISTIEAYTYNEYGEAVSKTDGEGNVTSYAYDPCGRLASVTVNTDETTSYAYDKEGNKISMTDGNGHVTTYGYGNFGLMTSITDAEGITESYEYDARGNMTAKTDGNREVVNYTYDANNNLISTANGDILISYEYDALGNRTGMEDESGAYVYTYDCGNRLTKVTKDGAAYVSYSYDILGNVTSINGTAYTYDECNRMKTAGNVSYEYDRNGNLAKTVMPAGTTEYTYDERNRVVKVENKVGGNVLSGYRYEYYNNNLEKKKIDNTNKKTEYTYDGAGRLVKTEINDYDSNLYYTNSYQYDNAGNRIFMQQEKRWVSGMSTGEPYSIEGDISPQSDGYYYACVTTNYLYDNANRMTMYKEEFRDTSSEEVENQNTKVVRYVFDEAGNQISTAAEFLTPETNETEEYGVSSDNYDSVVEVSINEYNGLNQLVNTTNIKDGNRSFASYVYNGDGLRVQKTVDGKVTDYVLSGGEVIAETGKTYLRGMSYHAVTNSDGTFYYFCNSHGDVTGITGSSGATAATYDYDEFGNLTEQTGDLDNDIRYAGEFYDSESENYYLRSRYYDPTVGRFTQQDSFLGVDDNPLSLNRYTYCHNNPVMFVDPSGHKDRSITIGGYSYNYNPDDFTSSEMDYKYSKIIGAAQRGEIGAEEFLRLSEESGVSMRLTRAYADTSENSFMYFDFGNSLTNSESMQAINLMNAFFTGGASESSMREQLDILTTNMVIMYEVNMAASSETEPMYAWVPYIVGLYGGTFYWKEATPSRPSHVNITVGNTTKQYYNDTNTMSGEKLVYTKNNRMYINIVQFHKDFNLRNIFTWKGDVEEDNGCIAYISTSNPDISFNMQNFLDDDVQLTGDYKIKSGIRITISGSNYTQDEVYYLGESITGEYVSFLVTYNELYNFKSNKSQHPNIKLNVSYADTAALEKFGYGYTKNYAVCYAVMRYENALPMLAVINLEMNNAKRVISTMGSYIGGQIIAKEMYSFNTANNVDEFIQNKVSILHQDEVKGAFMNDIKLTKLQKDTTVYRYHGGVSNAKSYWVTPFKTKNPASDLALPPGNNYQYVSTYVVPKGTTIIEGTVAPNFNQPGGGYQYYIADPSVLIQIGANYKKINRKMKKSEEKYQTNCKAEKGTTKQTT